MNVRGSLERGDIETFFEETTVPLRLSCRTPGGRLWMVSLWFRFREGVLESATSASADVVSFLEADPGVAFEVSTNDPPYRGVRGNGTATISPDPEKEVLRALCERYLGTTESDLAGRLLEPDRREVTVRIEPETVAGWDYTSRMSDGPTGSR